MNPVKKVLHLNVHYRRLAGAETLLFNTLEVLESKGIENVVVYENGENSTNTKRNSYQVKGISEIKMAQDPGTGKQIKAILEREKPDLIHLYDWGHALIPETCLDYAPVIQTTLNHGFYCPGGALFLKRFDQPCERSFGPYCLASAFLARCNSIRPNQLIGTYARSKKMMDLSSRLTWIVLSEDQKRRLLQNGVQEKKIHVLPPGISMPVRTEPLPSKPTILFVGRLIHVKGLQVVFEAMLKMKNRAQLLVDGEGPDRASLEKQAGKLGLSERVKFLGWCEPKEHWENYQKAFVVVVPSVWPEPFGLVGVEAMSYARPVIGSRLGGIPDWLEDEKSGFLIPADNPEAMAEKLDHLLSNPEQAEKMGLAGKQIVQSRFSLADFQTKLLNIYESAKK